MSAGAGKNQAVIPVTFHGKNEDYVKDVDFSKNTPKALKQQMQAMKKLLQHLTFSHTELKNISVLIMLHLVQLMLFASLQVLVKMVQNIVKVFLKV